MKKLLTRFTKHEHSTNYIHTGILNTGLYIGSKMSKGSEQ